MASVAVHAKEVILLLLFFVWLCFQCVHVRGGVGVVRLFCDVGLSLLYSFAIILLI